MAEPLVKIEDLKVSKRSKWDDAIDGAIGDWQEGYGVPFEGVKVQSLLNRFYKLQREGKIDKAFRITVKKGVAYLIKK